MFIKALEKNIVSSDEGLKIQKDYLADQPGPMQSRYDSALVEGQWQMSEMKKKHDDMLRALSILKEIADFHSEIIDNGSIIILNQNGSHNGYLLLNAKGAAGVSVMYEGEKFVIITPQSPLGEALNGKKPGDIVEFKTSRVMKCKIEGVY